MLYDAGIQQLHILIRLWSALALAVTSDGSYKWGQLVINPEILQRNYSS